jgi:lysophospholipase L1-like esterase
MQMGVRAGAEERISSESSFSGDWDDLHGLTPWVFLGDSNTYSGGYVAVLDAWLRSEGNAQTGTIPKLLNLGVSSETASGLSEVDHPFKRPCVHERLTKVLTMTRPAVIFACYGMNDGIYAPSDTERLAAYKAGMRRIADAARSQGAVLICMTPPIFEPEPVMKKGKLGPSEQGRFAYFAPYEHYDLVLQEQAEWLLTNEIGADYVIDIRTVLQAEKMRRQVDEPEFAFSGDGVHFGSEAHGLVAEAILSALGAPADVMANYPTPASIDVAMRRMQLLRNAYLSATGKNRPGLPAGEPVWLAERLAERLTNKE